MQTTLKNPIIRVALVEDDANFQNDLIHAMHSAPDMSLVKVVGTRALALHMLDELIADVLLVDLGLPDGSGIDVIAAAHRQWPDCNIMVSTAFGDETHVMRSVEAGATGYLLKDSAPDNMIFEIRSLFAGGSPISPLIARQVLTRFHQAAAPARLADKTPALLSAREQVVLEHLTKGYSTPEIAQQLGVSRHTIRTYVRRIYEKLEVNSKTEAIYEARYQRLLAK
ncbi:MAG: response regulator transcription factor [Sideroxydans sp.]|nr:response regulator transcription factor [Sideroxydans sp.]